MRQNTIESRLLVRLAGLVLIALAFLAGCGNRDRGPATADAKAPDASTAAAKASDPTTVSGSKAALEAPAPANPQVTSIPAAAVVDGAESPARAQLSNAASSVDELMALVLEALAHADPAALDALRLTEEEHREILWPADPGQASGAPLDLAWDMLDRRSRSGVHKAIAEHGGRTLNLTGVEFTRGTEPRGSYALYRGPVLYTRDSSRGESLELRFLGSVIERDGRWKLVSFRD
jgi:hypothetical protein